MPNKPNAKENFIKYLKIKGLGIEKFIESIGLKYGNYKGIAKKQALNANDLAIIITKCKDLDPRWLLTGEGEMSQNIHQEASEIKKYSEGQAPYFPISAVASIFERDIRLSAKDIQTYNTPIPNVEFFVNVKGNSMEPYCYDNDIIGCRIDTFSSIFFEYDKVYLIQTIEGPIVKRLKKHPSDKNIIIMHSDNPIYDEFEYRKNDIYGIAKVLGVIRID